MSIWRLSIVSAICVVLLTMVNPAQGATSDPPTGPLIVIITDRLAFEDFVDFPQATAHLQEVMSTGAVGMMNVRTAGAADTKNGYLSLASGIRSADHQGISGLALMADETIGNFRAADIHFGLTGIQEGAPIIHLGVHVITGHVGAIGSLLMENGLVAAVIGNGDSMPIAYPGGNTSVPVSFGIPSYHRRFAGVFATDRNGHIRWGDVGEQMNTVDITFPGSVRADDASMIERVISVSDVADVIFIDYADIARSESHADLMMPNREKTVRQETLMRLGAFVEEVLIRASTLGADVILLSPSPSVALGREPITLTPVVSWSGPDAFQRLTSPTTRRPGIVANIDFVPTLLRHFDIQSDIPFAGRPWQPTSVSGANPRAPLTEVISEYTFIKTVHQQRLPVIRTYFYAALTVLTSGIVLTYVRLRQLKKGLPFSLSSGWSRLLEIIVTGLLSVPLSMLLIGTLNVAPLSHTFLRLTFATAIITALSIGFARVFRLTSVSVTAILTAGTIIIDIWTGTSLMQKSLLGYDPVAGSRYYGIGNEYMGVLLGSALIATSAFVTSSPRASWPEASLTRTDRLTTDPIASTRSGWITTLTMIAISAMLIHPQLGVNVGGAISALAAAVAAFGFSQSSIARGSMKRVSLKLIFPVVTIVIVAIVLLITVGITETSRDLESASHWGRFVSQVSSGHDEVLWSTFGRKIQTNINLIRLTIWSRVVFVAFALIATFLFWPSTLMDQVRSAHRSIIFPCQTAFVAALIALIVNDSGVVAAATLVLWPTLALLCHMLCYKRPLRGRMENDA